MIKDIKGLEGLYAISDKGQVYKIGRCKKPHIIKQKINSKGYHKIVMLVKGKRYIYRVHKLVANAFIPNPLNKPQVNHIDGNKDNNCVDNLEWVTDEENRIHAIKNNLSKNTKVALLYKGQEIVRYDSINQANILTNKRYGNVFYWCKVNKPYKYNTNYQWVIV